MTNDGEEVDLVGNEVPCITTPLDVETMIVDGIKGVAVAANSVRLSFIENVLDTNAAASTAESIKARHVVNLAMDHSGFKAIMELLNRVLADMQAREDG
ncbi:hypothetical protein [Novosphingobium aquae]|uniref:Uncharacterized protein n=1 Tax=Novosphingobium aquae TaxID=3133435 RepID=A0ABU8S4C3_9SPHN